MWSASLEFDADSKLYVRLFTCDNIRRDGFDFPIVNISYLSSNIPKSAAYVVIISQLIRHARVCSKYEDFLFRGYILVSKLLRRDILHENFRLLISENYMVVIQTFFTNLTLLCHIYIYVERVV